MRIVLLLVVLASAGAATWLALRDPAPRPESSVEARGHASEEAREGPTLQGRAGPGPRAVPRGHLVVQGHARLSSGKPAAGATLVARLERVGEVARTEAGADGAYALTGLPPGLHHVEALLVVGEQEHAAEGYVTAGGDPYDLTLTVRPRTLELRVLDAQGEPVPRFQVRLVKPGGTVENLGVRGEGRVRLRLGVLFERDGVLDVRGAFVEVWGARDADDRGLALVPRRVGPLTGDEREVEVRLQPGSVIAGRVLGPDGPVGEAILVSVTLPEAKPTGMAVIEESFEEALEEALPGMAEETAKTPTPRAPFQGLKTEVKTDAEGVFQVAGLGVDTEHVLEVTAPPRFLPPAPVQARPGDPPLELRLRTTVAARIRVLGPDGKPRAGVGLRAVADVRRDGAAPGARLRALWNPTAEVTTDAGGTATLERLDPTSTYTLHVDPGDERNAWLRNLPEETRRRMGRELPPAPDASLPAAAKQRLAEWRPADTTVRLKPAYRVEGVVQDSEGRPVQHAQVWLQREGDTDLETTDEEGRFVFEAQEAGRVRLRAQNASSGGFTVFTGGAEVRPEADAPHTLTLELDGNRTGVVLRVPSTLSVTLRIAAAPAPSTGPPKPADLLRNVFRSMQVTLVRRTPEGWEPAGQHFADFPSLVSGKEQKVELKGLEPGQRYGAWMPPHEGRYLWVEFAAEAGTVEAERREGGVVTGRVHDLPAGSRFARVSLSDDHGREVSGVKTDAEGRFEVRGLPSAQWTVRATHDAPGGKHLVAEGRAATGGDVELRLVAAPRRAWVEEAEDDGWDDGPALPEPAPPPVVVPAR